MVSRTGESSEDPSVDLQLAILQAEAGHVSQALLSAHLVLAELAIVIGIEPIERRWAVRHHARMRHHHGTTAMPANSGTMGERRTRREMGRRTTTVIHALRPSEIATASA